VSSGIFTPAAHICQLGDTYKIKFCGGMRMRAKPRFIRKFPFVAPCLAAALGLLFLTSSLSQQAEALPAFARKYGLSLFRLPRSLADAQLLRPKV